ncbi:endonuclease/exonuclease/phosphatase family protein [Colwellia sp. Bg11-12]|uniref:endonuclease/exonuclease/phosphatase family protein n=1 Tax=Colwellia sp. Bg11-12 TaxID=2759817 RepID=UPI0015F6AB71|nr:endonuclease/exonuclease/phosphatase family protein [Colwellia sp. Bg11-12]MBA6265149.1 endonuclease/exonuclease/phosphatase family protein [Colwellia sp. Bg11-12]
MKNKIKKWIITNTRRLISPYVIFCSLACILVTLLPWWPSFDSLILPKYLLLFGPRWWLLGVVLFILIGWFVLSKRQKITFFILILLSLNYLDFQLPQFFHGNAVGKEIKIISANIGGGGSKEVIQLLVASEEPDILLLQEALKINLNELLGKSYTSECFSGLCIASKYGFENIAVLDRKLFGGWGQFARFYKIDISGKEVLLANIHLETPRSALMGAIYGYFDFDLAKRIESNREYEANLLKSWLDNKSNTIIAGDFNMPEDDNLFQRNFSELNNAIGKKGIGFNYTKHTSWHGVRIDHILFTDDFQINDVQTIDFLKGDHRPVVATLIMGD